MFLVMALPNPSLTREPRQKASIHEDTKRNHLRSHPEEEPPRALKAPNGRLQRPKILKPRKLTRKRVLHSPSVAMVYRLLFLFFPTGYSPQRSLDLRTAQLSPMVSEV